MLTARTLRKTMPGLDRAGAKRYLPGIVQAMHLAECTTVHRAAMFLAMIGEESLSLRYTQEIADGSEYNGRGDLGNTQPGDGPRFKGRSFIQITGRSNYAAFSSWAHKHGLVPTSTYFVFHPAKLADDRFAAIGAAWYWIKPHPHDGLDYLNTAADKGRIETATRMVNGGLNGLSDRRTRYERNLKLGVKILPGAAAVTDPVAVQAVNLSAKAHFNNYDPSSFGWPKRVPDLVPFSFEGTDFGQCARDVHAVFTAILTELVPHVPGGISFGPHDDWAYSTTDDLPDGSWSFHRYGIAFDLNWRENPMGSYSSNPDAGQKGAIPHAIASRIARKYGCEYGGDWHGFKDFMHFECHLSPSVAAAYRPAAPVDPMEEILSYYKSKADFEDAVDQIVNKRLREYMEWPKDSGGDGKPRKFFYLMKAATKRYAGKK